MIRTHWLRLRHLALRREGLFLLGSLALVAATAIAFTLARPTALILAAGPREGPEARLVETYAALLGRERDGLSITVTYQDDVRDAALALEAGRADLAVVRPDVKSPENGLTLAILRDEVLVVAAPEAAGLTDLAGLARRRLGVVARHDADLPFVANVLRYYDLAAEVPATLAAAGGAAPQGGVAPVGGAAPSGTAPAPPGTVTLVPLRADAVAAALSERRIDAVAVVAAPSGGAATEVVRAVEGASRDRRVALLGVPEADAIAARLSEVQAATIPAGAFGGRPKRPAEELRTVGVSYRLMARDRLGRQTAAAVTQSLFERRGRLGGAPGLKAPDFETAVAATSARLANHPGAVDYFQREQLTFFQQYGDWVYLAMFGAGSVGSALAWLSQRFARKRRALFDVVLDRLLDVLGEAREGRSVADLDALALEIDGLVIHAVRYARRSATDARTMSALILAIDSARAAIADCRRALLDAAGDPRTDAADRPSPGARAAAE